MTLHPFGPREPQEEGFAEGQDGTRIHYAVHGDSGPTLVFCDGIGCDGFVWKYMLRELSPTYRILRWHYRGHGRSGLPKDRTRTTFDDLCGDLEAVLRATGTRTATLFGHSMGVQVCLEYHRRHAEQVEALVLICGSHGLPLDTFHDSKVLRTVVPPMLQAADKWPEASKLLWKLAAGGELAYQIATHFEVNGKLIRREDFMPYFDHLSSMDPRLFLSMLTHAGAHSAYDHLPAVHVPTLIVAGTQDSFTPYWLSEEMHDRIAGSEMLTIPGGTHTAPIEQPELVQLRLDRFLERVRSEAPRQVAARTS